MNGKFFTVVCGRCDEFFHSELAKLNCQRWHRRCETGAIIGGAATGHFAARRIGAAAGAAAGALNGRRTIEADAGRALRSAANPVVFRSRAGTGTTGLYYSPYTGRVYNLRGVPPGGLNS